MRKRLQNWCETAHARRNPVRASTKNVDPDTAVHAGDLMPMSMKNDVEAGIDDLKSVFSDLDTSEPEPEPSGDFAHHQLAHVATATTFGDAHKHAKRWNLEGKTGNQFPGRRVSTPH